MICTEPHKRVRVPRWDDYACYTRLIDGVRCLVNNKGYVFYRFKDEDEYNKKGQPMIDAIFMLYRKQYDEYLIHARSHPEYYIQTYEEANCIHRAMYKGFVCRFESWSKLMPYSNWFGCSRGFYPEHSPDRELVRGNKEIHLSLQGLTCAHRATGEVSARYYELFKNRAIRYVAFIEDGDYIYENWTGKFPDDDFISKFIE